MGKVLKNITFDEALALTRSDVPVYSINLENDKKLTVKRFDRLEIGEAVKPDTSFYIVEDKAE